MLTVKNRDDLYILIAYMGLTSLELGGTLRIRLSLLFWLTNLHFQYTIEQISICF